MINNNTIQQTPATSGTVVESTAYLKKTDLPKNVSAFKNDVGYISSSALNDWMKTHSYISKKEIESLIQKANLVVKNSIINSIDDDIAISKLNEYLNDISGLQSEVTAIKNKLKDLGANEGFITLDKVNNFATKTEINNLKNNITNINSSISQLESNSSNYLTEHQSLDDYVKINDIPSLDDYAKTTYVDKQISQVKNKIPKLDGYATEEWVEDKRYLTSHQSLADYAKKSDIPSLTGYAPKTYVDAQVNQLKSQIPTLTGFATKNWVNEQGFLTEHQSLDGYATESWVEGKGYLTKHQSLSSYAKKSEIPTKLSDLTNDTGYLTKHQSLNDYAKKDWVEEQGYLTSHQSLADYAKKSDIPSLTGYAKTSDVISRLNDYAKKDTVYDKGYINSELGKLLSKEDASDIYAVNEEVQKTYLTKTEAGKYLKIEDYRGIKEASTINTEYIEKRRPELIDDLDRLINGFYIVDYKDIVIIKDHQIISMFEDGVPSGYSAYEIAKKHGYTGTEQQWLNSLVGATGPQGEQGIQGIPGVQGEAGPKGDTGETGKSAYAIAVDNGFEGTALEWLESLKSTETETHLKWTTYPRPNSTMEWADCMPFCIGESCLNTKLYIL